MRRILNATNHDDSFFDPASKRDKRVYITLPDQLAAFCERAASAKVLAIDTEFLRERTYYPKLCLIQAATGDEVALIDPIALDDLSAFANLLADDSIVKVFHACSQDLEVLHAALGVVPKPVFDTQVAATFLGLRQQMGYGALVEELCGVHLAKAEALSDWTHRPLSAHQLDYAEDDVRYLPRMYDDMVRRLSAADRLGWVLPEMDALIEKAETERDPRLAFLHLKRTSSLTRKQMGVAREACAWREQVAAERDVPRRWVVSDEVIVECCRRIPRDAAALRRIRGAEQMGDKMAAGLLRALRKGSSANTADIPHQRRHERPSPETEGALDLMYALTRIVAKQNNLAVQLLASRDDLHDYLLRRPSPLDNGWRHDLLATRLDQLLDGECGLTVKDGHVELL